MILFFQCFLRRQGSSLDRPCLRREPNNSLDRPCLRREPNTSLDRRISSDRFSLDLPNISEHNILPSPTNRTSLDRPTLDRRISSDRFSLDRPCLRREPNTSLDRPNISSDLPNISLDVPNISLDRPCLRREPHTSLDRRISSDRFSLDVPNISLDRPCLRREDSIYSAYTLTSMGYSLESEVGFQHYLKYEIIFFENYNLYTQKCTKHLLSKFTNFTLSVQEMYFFFKLYVLCVLSHWYYYM